MEVKPWAPLQKHFAEGSSWGSRLLTSTCLTGGQSLNDPDFSAGWGCSQHLTCMYWSAHQPTVTTVLQEVDALCPSLSNDAEKKCCEERGERDF